MTARTRFALLLLPLAAAPGCHQLGQVKQKTYAATRGILSSSYDDPQAEEKVQQGEQLLADGQPEKAAKVFADVAGNSYNPILLAEKARFLQAEAYRSQKKYPDAVDTYHKMLVDFPGGAYRERACTEIFKIADYWLDDTRAEIQAEQAGKSTTSVKLANMVKFDRSRPTTDVEGRALQALDYVHTNDVAGPTADKALFWAGYVNFYRGNFVEADHYFSLLVEMYKDSPLRPQAVELAVIAKNNSTGGAVYDGQKAAEALQLVHHAEATMPEFRTEDKSGFLTRQKLAIRMQQAEKDFERAAYYERTKKPGSAYFYYEMVRRRYPGTKYSDLAGQRMEGLKAAAERGEVPMDAVDRAGKMVRGTWEKAVASPLGIAPQPPESGTPTGPTDRPPPVELPDGIKQN